MQHQCLNQQKHLIQNLYLYLPFLKKMKMDSLHIFFLFHRQKRILLPIRFIMLLQTVMIFLKILHLKKAQWMNHHCGRKKEFLKNMEKHAGTGLLIHIQMVQQMHTMQKMLWNTSMIPSQSLLKKSI